MLIPFVSLLLLVPSSLHAQSVTTVPTKFTMGFEWATNSDSTMQIPSCATMDFTYQSLAGSTVTPVGPFKIWVIVPNNPIYRYTTTTSDFPGVAHFNLGVAAGNQVAFLMEDANGYSGGAVGPYTVTAGSSNCTIYGSQGQLGIQVTPGYETCGPIQVVVTGGTAPYYYHLVESDPAHAFVGGGSVNSNSFTLDPTTFVTAGQMFSIWVQDSNNLFTVNFEIQDTVGTPQCVSSSSSSSSPITTTTTSTTTSVYTTTSNSPITVPVISSSSSSATQTTAHSTTWTTSHSGSSTSTTSTSSIAPTPSSISVALTTPRTNEFITITPSGGTAPYRVVVLFGSVTEVNSTIPAGSYDWQVVIPEGSQFTVSVTDSTGKTFVSQSYEVLGKKKSTPIGAIVGGVVGGIALIVALILIYVFCVRNREPKDDDIKGEDWNDYHPSPPINGTGNGGAGVLPLTNLGGGDRQSWQQNQNQQGWAGQENQNQQQPWGGQQNWGPQQNHQNEVPHSQSPGPVETDPLWGGEVGGGVMHGRPEDVVGGGGVNPGRSEWNGQGQGHDMVQARY